MFDYRKNLFNIIVFLAVTLVLFIAVMFSYFFSENALKGYTTIKNKFEDFSLKMDAPTEDTTEVIKPKMLWKAPDLEALTDVTQKTELNYGKDLVAHTAKYLGPNGSVSASSNGLNCQNCHLDAGTKPWGNNYGSVFATYPKFRARSGKVEDVYKRINDCFERSLNGKALDLNSKELKAMAAYINFLGKDVAKGEKAYGSGFKNIEFLSVAADPKKGEEAYKAKCQSCHQANGEGMQNAGKTEFLFPPLWGASSYNDGAGLYRISNFAKYIKYNMPLGVTAEAPQLTDEEAWNIAAFVNSQKRPHFDVSKDWPDISKKSFDNPVGPYADNFSEKQHKYGPFLEMNIKK